MPSPVSKIFSGADHVVRSAHNQVDVIRIPSDNVGAYEMCTTTIQPFLWVYEYKDYRTHNFPMLHVAEQENWIGRHLELAKSEDLGGSSDGYQNYRLCLWYSGRMEKQANNTLRIRYEPYMYLARFYTFEKNGRTHAEYCDVGDRLIKQDKLRSWVASFIKRRDERLLTEESVTGGN